MVSTQFANCFDYCELLDWKKLWKFYYRIYMLFENFSVNFYVVWMLNWVMNFLLKLPWFGAWFYLLFQLLGVICLEKNYENFTVYYLWYLAIFCKFSWIFDVYLMIYAYLMIYVYLTIYVFLIEISHVLIYIFGYCFNFCGWLDRGKIMKILWWISHNILYFYLNFCGCRMCVL